jgi:uncharacterized repeat protein (TIGR01451 family)
VPVGEPYDVRVHWNLPDAAEGDLYFGTAVLGTSPDSPGDIGEIPIRLSRVADDVTKTASVDAAGIGDAIGYDITVQPNVTPEDLTYTVTDTVPDGLTVDPASVTGDGVVDGQTVTWEVEMPTQVGAAGTYEASTPADDPQCAAWAGFVDLGAAGVGFSTLDGDSTAVNAFSNIGPFPQYTEQSPNLTVSDDGLITIAGGYAGEPWTPQELPSTATPNGVIAPLWSDLELSLANDRGVRLATSGGQVAVVQWDDPFEYGGDPADLSNSVGTFQAWIYNSVADDRPEITFEYADLGALPETATVGIENLAGTLGTAVVNAGDPSTVLTEGGSICLDYVGPDVDPVTLSYETTVDADALSGTYTNSAEHVTSDPFDEPAVASTDVEVTGIAAPAWDRKTVYRAGDEVSYDGAVYVALWWTRGDKPGRSAYGPWAEVGTDVACGDETYQAWTESWVYTGGETVAHDGRLWQATWWNRNQEPGATPWGPWKDRGAC